MWDERSRTATAEKIGVDVVIDPTSKGYDLRCVDDIHDKIFGAIVVLLPRPSLNKLLPVDISSLQTL